MPAAGPISSARTASLRVTQQEYDALQSEAKQRGFHQLSSLMRFYLFGYARRVRNFERPETDMTMLGDILGRLTVISGALGTNGTYMAAIAGTLDQGFRDAFGLDYCLRFSEQLSHELCRTLEYINKLACEQQKLMKQSRKDREK